jgi:hypothetical protein
MAWDSNIELESNARGERRILSERKPLPGPSTANLRRREPKKKRPPLAKASVQKSLVSLVAKDGYRFMCDI